MNQMVMLMAVGFFAFSFFNWKKAVIFSLYWVLLVGAVRKWVITGGGADLIVFSGHWLLLGAYIKFLVERKWKSIKYPGSGLLILFIAWGFFSLFNSRMPDYRIGLLGIIVYFYFIPFAFMIPVIFQDKEKIIKFLKKYAIISLPLLILGIFQFLSPENALINRYVSGTGEVASVGGRARITSTFSYITGYTIYLSFLLLLNVFIISVRKVSKKMASLIFGIIALVGINIFMTGTRGVFGFAIISTAIYLIFASRLGFGFALKIMPKVILFVCVSVLVVTTTFIGKEAHDTFMIRYKQEGSQAEMKLRILDYYNPFEYFEKVGFMGYGIGTTYQGTERFNVDWGDMPRQFEAEPTRTFLELGLIGFFFVYLLRFEFIFLAFKFFKTVKDTDLKLLAIACALFQVQFVSISNLAQNITASFLYWFTVGLLFAIYNIKRRQEYA